MRSTSHCSRARRDCNGRDSQWWVFLSDSWAIAYGPDKSKCIDVPGGDLTPGNVLQIWDCNQLDNQKWGYDSEQKTIYLASSAEASVCMDLTGGDATPGTGECRSLLKPCDIVLSWRVRCARSHRDLGV